MMFANLETLEHYIVKYCISLFRQLDDELVPSIVLFDEQTIPTHENVLEKRWEERKDIIELRHKAAVDLHLKRAEEERQAALNSGLEPGAV